LTLNAANITCAGGTWQSGQARPHRHCVTKELLAEDESGDSCLFGAFSVVHQLRHALAPEVSGDLEGLQLVFGISCVGEAVPSMNSSLIYNKSINNNA